MLDIAVLKDTDGVEGLFLHKPHAVLKDRQFCPGRQQCLDLDFLVCVELPSLRLHSFPMLAVKKKPSHMGSEVRRTETGLCQVSFLQSVTRLMQNFASQNEFFF